MQGLELEDLEEMQTTKKEKKLGRIPEIRIEPQIELILSRRANFEGRTLSNYVAHILRLHAVGVAGTARLEGTHEEDQ